MNLFLDQPAFHISHIAFLCMSQFLFKQRTSDGSAMTSQLGYFFCLNTNVDQGDASKGLFLSYAFVLLRYFFKTCEICHLVATKSFSKKKNVSCLFGAINISFLTYFERSQLFGLMLAHLFIQQKTVSCQTLQTVMSNLPAVNAE